MSDQNQMLDQNRDDVVILLFLFAAVALGMFACLIELQVALSKLTDQGPYGKGAALSLVDGIFNLSFSLYLLSFIGAYKSKEIPGRLLDVLSMAFFMRFLFLGFTVYHLIPVETWPKISAFELRYTSAFGLLLGVGQTFFTLIGLAFLSKGDEPDAISEERGRHGLPSIDSLVGEGLQGGFFGAAPPKPSSHPNKPTPQNVTTEADKSPEPQETKGPKEPQEGDQKAPQEDEVLEETEATPKETNETSAKKKAKKRRKKSKK